MSEGKGRAALAADQGLIRLATADDLPLLPAIELAAGRLFLEITPSLGLDEAVFQTARPLEELRKGLDVGLLWVAVDVADRPIGFALALELEGHLHLEEMDVHPNRGRRGIGTALVRTVCAAAHQRGQVVTLSTFRHVPWNAPFYAKLGFRELEDFELTPGLLQLREEEAQRGLKIETRVFMIWDWASEKRRGLGAS